MSLGDVSDTTSNSDVTERAIPSLLVEWKERGLDREMHPEKGEIGQRKDPEKKEIYLR